MNRPRHLDRWPEFLLAVMAVMIASWPAPARPIASGSRSCQGRRRDAGGAAASRRPAARRPGCLASRRTIAGPETQRGSRRVVAQAADPRADRRPVPRLLAHRQPQPLPGGDLRRATGGCRRWCWPSAWRTAAGSCRPSRRRSGRSAADEVWVLPAHDRGLQNFHGKTVEIDLLRRPRSWNLATAALLAGRQAQPARRAS